MLDLHLLGIETEQGGLVALALENTIVLFITPALLQQWDINTTAGLLCGLAFLMRSI